MVFGNLNRDAGDVGEGSGRVGGATLNIFFLTKNIKSELGHLMQIDGRMSQNGPQERDVVCCWLY